MNTSFQKITACLGLAISLGLASCQKDSLITPDQPKAVTSQAVSNDISPNLPKNYKLSKYGQANLTYYADGRLKQVMDGPDVRGSLAARTEYTYSAGTIKALTYSGNSLVVDQTYLLDVATNRCYEFKELWYIYSNSDQTKETNLVFTYNEKGQLKTRADKKSPKERTEYTYNADGDVSKAIQYGAPQFAYSPIALRETTFAYDQPTGDPLLTDLHPLTTEWIDVPNPYLKIFGKLGKHLVKLEISKPSAGSPYQSSTQRYYSYTLNADGYVTQRKAFELFNAALVETRSYDYQVSTIGFQF